MEPNHITGPSEQFHSSLLALAKYIRPNAVTWCKLAMVSKAFFTVFTSDKVWQFLDIYNVKHDIYKSYLNSCKACRCYGQLNCTTCIFEHITSFEAYILFRWRSYDKQVCISDHHLMWCAVNVNGMALKFASKELRDNFDLVLAAVQTPLNLENPVFPAYNSTLDYRWPRKIRRPEAIRTPLAYASHRCRDSRTIATAAIHVCGDSLEWCTSRLKKDKSLVLLAIENDHRLNQTSLAHFRSDRQVVRAAVQNCGILIRDTCFGDDEEIVRLAVSNDGASILYVSPRFQADKQLVIKAVEQYGVIVAKEIPLTIYDYDVILAGLKSGKLLRERPEFSFCAELGRSTIETLRPEDAGVFTFSGIKVEEPSLDMIKEISTPIEDYGFSLSLVRLTACIAEHRYLPAVMRVSPLTAYASTRWGYHSFSFYLLGIKELVALAEIRKLREYTGIDLYCRGTVELIESLNSIKAMQYWE